ncbi:MAG: ATP-binding protein [Candidatus Micrarchaeaceae archaeon]
MIEKIEITNRWWRRHLESSIPDLPRALIELIMNSADSYKRLKNSESKLIIIEYEKGFCSVTDNAEGMTREKLKEVSLKYGGLTSGINIGEKVSGVFGVGLKEACLRLGYGEIITIKDGKLTRRSIFVNDSGEPETEELEYRDANDIDRFKYNIKGNGTQVKLTIPTALQMKSRLLFALLQRHWLLRKILEGDTYAVKFFDKQSNSVVNLNLPDSITKSTVTVLETGEKLIYKGATFHIKIKIFKVGQEIDYAWYADAPLLVVYNEDTVAEKSLLPNLENDMRASMLAGEVYVDGFGRLLSADESVLDEKRIGLDRRHPFNKELMVLVNDKIKPLLKQTSISERPNFDISKVLAVANNIAKNELQSDITTPPRNFRPPNGAIGFYYREEMDIKQEDEKSVFLVVSTQKIQKNVKISSSDGNIVELSPQEIELTKFKKRKNLDPDLRYARVVIKGQNIGSTVVKAEAGEYIDKLVVSVKHNEILDIAGIGFSPNKIEHPVAEKNNFLNLYIRKSILIKNEKIKLVSSHPKIHVPSAVIPDNFKSFGSDMLYSKIKISILEKVKVGEFATVQAIYNGLKTDANITIVKQISRLPKGLFRDIKDESNEASDEIARVAEDGTIYVNISHPVLRNYFIKDVGKKSAVYMAVYADAISRTIAKKIANKKFENNQLYIVDLKDAKAVHGRIENEVDKIYKKYGVDIHKAIISTAGNLYVNK